jgi:hypothetical protein
MKIIPLLVTSALVMSFVAESHVGRLNKQGGHNCSQKAQDKGLCTEYHSHKETNYEKPDPKTIKRQPMNSLSASEKYDRKTWPHWVDEDRDCQDARSETLIRDSIGPIKFKRNKGCNVSWGKWLAPYTNLIIEKASATDIDHMVPLGHAHFVGGMHWTKEQKRAFANDPENLLVTSPSANRSKSDRGPDEWMPQYKPYHCTYLGKWVDIKFKYDLTFPDAELEYLISRSKECNLGFN